MRSESVMFDLILEFARRENRVRAVYLNGSRANPNAPRDIMQDYDVVYVVTEIRPYREDPSWIAAFGEIAVMQEPDNSALFDDGFDPDERYAYLMQFTDGVRIDLSFQSISFAQSACLEDKLTVPLLDKDGLLPPIPPPTDEDYRVKRPTAEQYAGCCNEYHWVSTYIAKGLWRGELLYAIDHFNLYARPMLLKMLEWMAGCSAGFCVNTGKCNKYLPRYIPKEMWERLLSTYPPMEPQAMWTALFTMSELFDQAAVQVGNALGFCYNQEESQRTRRYLEQVRDDRFGTSAE